MTRWERPLLLVTGVGCAIFAAFALKLLDNQLQLEVPAQVAIGMAIYTLLREVAGAALVEWILVRVHRRALRGLLDKHIKRVNGRLSVPVPWSKLDAHAEYLQRTSHDLRDKFRPWEAEIAAYRSIQNYKDWSAAPVIKAAEALRNAL